jgi:hypothetical protein
MDKQQGVRVLAIDLLIYYVTVFVIVGNTQLAFLY